MRRFCNAQHGLDYGQVRIRLLSARGRHILRRSRRCACPDQCEEIPSVLLEDHLFFFRYASTEMCLYARYPPSASLVCSGIVWSLKHCHNFCLLNQAHVGKFQEETVDWS